MIVVQTPLRLSFLGGGTDFEDFYLQHGGAVLCTAINKCVFVIVKERFDDDIYVNYSRKEKVNKIDDLKHELVREAMRVAGVYKGIEITTLADIPSEGTGLGSSSSITVSLLQALYTFNNESQTAQQLARKASDIEINVLGKPIGKQDHYIAAYGNLRFITFNSDSINVETVELSREAKIKLNSSLMLFYTGKTRDSATILIEQKDNIAKRIHILKELKEIAFSARDSLIAGDFDEFGEMLHRGWELKKNLARGITDSSIDEIYEAARKAGAIGGKIAGAGGGGFFLLYCPVKKQDNVRSVIKLREFPFHFEEDGSKVIFNYRR